MTKRHVFPDPFVLDIYEFVVVLSQSRYAYHAYSVVRSRYQKWHLINSNDPRARATEGITMLKSEFSVTTARVSGCVEVTLSGELDEATVDELRRVFVACDSNRPLVVDLTAVTFISSAGIHVLLTECLGARPAALVVAEGSHVERVFDIARVGKSVPVYHDLRTAMDFPPRDPVMGDPKTLEVGDQLNADGQEWLVVRVAKNNNGSSITVTLQPLDPAERVVGSAAVENPPARTPQPRG